MTESPRIGISYHRSGGNPLKYNLIDRVSQWADIEHWSPDTVHADELADLDLYHAAKIREPSLQDLQDADESSVQTVNTYDAVIQAVDRVHCADQLQGRWYSTPASTYGTLDDIDFSPPFIVKTRSELAVDSHEYDILADNAAGFDGHRMVEEYVEHSAVTKLYVIGDYVRPVRIETTNGTANHRDTEPIDVAVDPWYQQLAADISNHTGLTLFEVDVLEPSRHVVDVNPTIHMQDETDVAQYNQLLKETADAA